MHGAPTGEIIKVVNNCPSGELSYKFNREIAEQKSTRVEEVTIMIDREGPFILCRCGHTKIKSFCDNSYLDYEFDY